MKDFILDSGYGEWIRTPFSSNVIDQCIYLHWDCWKERPNEEWYRHIFRNKFDVGLGFIDFIYYALLHEELHLIFYKLGEEDFNVEEKTNIFHSELMSRILISVITGKTTAYIQKGLDSWL